MTAIDHYLLFDPDDIEIIRMLCAPIHSYAVDEYSPDYPSSADIILQKGECIQVSTTEARFDKYFDCFTLKFIIKFLC